MNIVIKDITGDHFALQVETNTEIEQIKQMIVAKKPVLEGREFFLYYGGHKLDLGKALMDYEICDSSVIMVVINTE